MDEPNYIRRLEIRIEHIERLARVAVGAACILIVCVLVLAASKGQSTSTRVVSAQAFELRDIDGKTRAKLSLKAAPQGGPSFAQLELFDELGNGTVFLNSGSSKGGPIPALGLQRGELMAQLNIGDSSGPTLLMNHKGATQPDVLLTPGLLSMQNADGSSYLQPSLLTLRDREGYQAQVGSTIIVAPDNGNKVATSAASILLFDKTKGVIWSAPNLK